jgi:hypothetical protein
MVKWLWNMKNDRIILVFFFLMFIVASSFLIQVRAQTATIRTDKADYCPGETVTIYGTGFLPNAKIAINVTKLADGTVTSWNVTSDANGSFAATYQIDNAGAPHYRVTATDGTNTATTAFKDAVISRVQPTTGSFRGTSTSSSISVGPLTSTPVSGDVLIATIGTRGTSVSTVSSISEPGVTWTKQIGYSDSSNLIDVEIWLGVVGSGASTSITVYLTSSAGYGAVADVVEYSGVGTAYYLDRTRTNSGSSRYPSTGTTSTTTVADELWIGATLLRSYSQDGTPTGGFTLVDGGLYNSQISLAYLEKIVTATGTAGSVTTSTTSAAWVGCIATFKAYYAIPELPWPTPLILIPAVVIAIYILYARRFKGKFSEQVPAPANLKKRASESGKIGRFQVMALLQAARYSDILTDPYAGIYNRIRAYLLGEPELNVNIYPVDFGFLQYEYSR